MAATVNTKLAASRNCHRLNGFEINKKKAPLNILYKTAGFLIGHEEDLDVLCGALGK